MTQQACSLTHGEHPAHVQWNGGAIAYVMVIDFNYFK